VIGSQEWLLIGAVGAVGTLHTVVPDHWVPITLIARQQGWTKGQVARAAFIAGTGHTVSTLLIGLVVWMAGFVFATKFGNLVSLVSSLALIAFGAWIAFSALRELGMDAEHGRAHSHTHEHTFDATANSYDTKSKIRADATFRNDVTREHANETDAALHQDAQAAKEPSNREHARKRSFRTTLLLILGSSPMVEGIPAFFAAGKFGAGLIVVMAVVFAISTIATYVSLCVTSVVGLQQVSLGPFERYGEVLSGAFITLVGLIFLIFPVL